MATGNYSNGTTQNLTALASWQSSNTSVATVSSTGLATAVAAGSTQIYAFYQGQSANVVLTVSSATLSSLSVTPTTATIASGTTQQFTATGTPSDGSTQNLTNSVTWSSSLQSVATINASGLATGVTVITATVGSTTATATLTVSAATVVSLQLSPASATLPTGSTQQLTGTATFSNTTSQNVTSSCTYTTSKAAVATVNTSGLVQGVSAGSATITATLGGSTATSTITVTSAALSSLAISPANPSLVCVRSNQGFDKQHLRQQRVTYHHRRRIDKRHGHAKLGFRVSLRDHHQCHSRLYQRLAHPGHDGGRHHGAVDGNRDLL
jgi:trimeric autotransporter adhesin